MPNDIRFITYATHQAGMFEQLVNNEYNVDITVLGMGNKWNGFMDKIKAVNEYAKTLDKDTIIVFLDGFDTQISKNIDGLIEEFKNYECDLLVSKDPSLKFISKKIFGDYPTIANAGMYMGYAEKIEKITSKMLNLDTRDDQEALNYCIYNFKDEFNTKIDIEKKIFYNFPFSGWEDEKDKNNSNYFKSYPGGNNNGIKYRMHRFWRGIFEYYPYLKYEIAVFFICLIIIMLLLNRVLKSVCST